jgi:hypothetical protein
VNYYGKQGKVASENDNVKGKEKGKGSCKRRLEELSVYACKRGIYVISALISLAFSLYFRKEGYYLVVDYIHEYE